MANPSQSTANPMAEFGGVPVDVPTPSSTTAQAQPAGSPSSPSTNPLAEFGGIAIPDEKATQNEVIASDASKIPNARIRNLPNPAEGMTPKEALVSGVKTGTELAAIPASTGVMDAVAGTMPFAEHIAGRVLEHGAELTEKYPNFVKLAGKLAPHLPLTTLAALTYAWEHFKK